ncbi:glycosyltransferase [Niabella sp. CC-SYL272]|uniref:glycosyltransferase family 2 protein n=1 Tax=Niabella agricola TaxID=2891571 RepID=UPI001F2B1201|nr:glycosyltransferase [Niabella agricola]MCF3108618.1 glycosyltransferase [Niabella agricola]
MTTKAENIMVSVIMPVYNVEAFLGAAIQSVLDQSIKDLELILVNDGSIDGSVSVCHAYLQKDPRIQFINQENSGVSIARNNGLLRATGSYVFFMDSDDTLDPEFFKTSLEAARKDNSDITVIGTYFCKWGPLFTALPTCAQLIRMDFLKQHSELRFPPHIQPCEDGLFSHQLLALTSKIGLNPCGIYHYRRHVHQNHIRINNNCWTVLRQIPVWLQILEDFYTRHQLLPSHTLHLARFIQHEPFELRYLRMPFNKEQKTYLHSLIITFMDRIVLPTLTTSEKRQLSRPFRYFLDLRNPARFDAFYRSYCIQKKRRRGFYLFLTRFIPFTQLRRKTRKAVAEKY